MKANMGALDRLVRLIIAAGVGFLYFKGYINGLTATILGVLAVVFLLTNKLYRNLPALLAFRAIHAQNQKI